MKKLFLLPAVLLVLASCSNDTIVEKNPAKVVDENVLQIYPAIAGVTRGTAYDNSNFTEFKLTTSKNFQEDATTVNDPNGAPFNGVTVKKQENGTWSVMKGNTATDYYWPSKSATNTFMAWAPIDEGSYTADNSVLSNLTDILVAYNKGTASDMASGVPLKFRHITSQIVVKADNAASNKIQIKVKGIRLNNIKNTGTWKRPTDALMGANTTIDALNYSPWSDVAGSVNYVVKLADGSEKTLSASTTDFSGTNPLFLIPQQLADGTASIKDASDNSGQYLSVLVQIQNKEDNSAIYPKINQNETTQGWAWAAVDINTLWEPGKKYIYTLHFKEGGYGKVDGDQGDGGDEDPTDGEKEPGDDVVDSPVKLVLDVTVANWEEVTEEHDM